MAQGDDEKDKAGDDPEGPGEPPEETDANTKESEASAPTGDEPKAASPAPKRSLEPFELGDGPMKWWGYVLLVFLAVLAAGGSTIGIYFAIDASKYEFLKGSLHRPVALGAGAAVGILALILATPLRWLFSRVLWILATKPGRAWFREHYFKIDPRTVGIFRLLHGFLLTADCIRHWKEARWFYSNAGVLTNHYHLFRPSSGYNFSIYHAFSSLPEVHIAFALSTLVYFLYFIGWRARIFSILSFILVTSMDNRLVMVENGGYVVVNLVTCWAMFLPTDRRFSVDALLRSFRERKEATLAELNEPYRPARETEPYVSAIVFLATLNLAVVYFFNVVNKSGGVWKAGYTVHYVLHLDRMVTGVAVFFREHLPFWATRIATWSVLAVEGMLIPLILSPYGRRFTRPIALILIWGLHTSFGVMMRLGPFSWFMMSWSMILPVVYNWDDLEAWYRRRAPARVAVLDGTSPLAFAIGRLLSRLNGLDLLRFEAAETGAEAASPELIAARDPDTGALFTGTAALREIIRALPGGKFFYPLFLVATLGLAGPVFRFASRKREAVARFFGLTIPPRGAEEDPTPSPLRLKIARGRGILREVFIAYLGVCAFWQALAENKNVPPVRNNKYVPAWIQKAVEQPSFVVVTIQYPRLYQGWGMFAPNPITDDGSLSIDAITVDGRHIDPFTGEAPDLNISDARGLGLNQIWQDYFNRIRLDRNKAFRQGLKDYLLNWHKETGRPEDELVAFDVYWVRDQCPKPGDTQPYKNETVALLTYRKPGYKPPPGLPPLPPEPKVESAGN